MAISRLDWYRSRAEWHGSHAGWHMRVLQNLDSEATLATQVFTEQAYNHARESMHWARLVWCAEHGYEQAT